ncbi:Ig-like domain-containing protein [Vibrio sp. MMG022]|uniref:Ig-like domain-containing protein n=1 Tax=Vibrio sp. MMG023 TaxID=2909979 RepID=UPI001F2D455B|nr:Ig-like domain-containing protein [Vibrio sp. MMG023]MCF6450644.1 Ig-like domain-containing protein [Vibrio sp. MMG023]
MIIGKYASKALACVGGFIGGVRFSSNSNSTSIGKALLSSSVSFPNKANLPSNEPTRADLRGDYLSVSSMPIQKVNSLKKWVRTLLPLSLLPILVACGGESESGNSSEIWPENQVDQYVSVHAEDFYSVVQSTDSEEVRVNVVDKVARSGGERISLAEVEVLSSDPSCQLVDSDNESFQIISDHAMVCDYQYTVGLDGYSSGYQMIGKRSGVSRVVVANNAQQAELVPFGVAGYQGETLEINIENELTKVGDNTSLSGFSLTDDVILMPKGSSSTVSLDKTNNKISYTPAATFKGNERILYTLENSSGNVLVGSAVVTVSERSSVGIDIPDKIEILDTVEVGKTATIDISPYVIDKQDDNFQLIQVVAFDSAVALSDASDTKNKTFTFRVEHAGQYYVNAIVTDHRGGFDVALMKIVAINPTQTGLWDDYYHNNQVYSAPLTKSEADSSGIRNDGTYFDSSHSVKPAVATFRPESASLYCGSFGRLPTSTELKAIWSHDKGNTKDWPLSRGYLSLDGSTYKVVSLSSGSTLTDDGQGYYVTCVSNGSLSIIAIDGTAVANDVDKAVVEVTFLINGEAAKGVSINASTTGDASFVEEPLTTNSEGKVKFELTNKKAEDIDVSVNVANNFTVSQRITFVADATTARLLQISTFKNNAAANGSSANQVIAHVADANLNPVEGIEVEFSSDSSTAKLNTSKVKTDADGNARVNITNTRVESVTVTGKYKEIGIYSVVRFVTPEDPYVDSYNLIFNFRPADGINYNRIRVLIKDRKTGRPLQGKRVGNLRTDTGYFHAISDSNGYAYINFTSRIVGTRTFSFTAGFESRSFTFTAGFSAPSSSSSGYLKSSGNYDGFIDRTLETGYQAKNASKTLMKSVELVKTNARSDGVDINKVSVVFVDERGNPKENQNVAVDVSGSAQITRTTKTNEEGVAYVYIVDHVSEVVALSFMNEEQLKEIDIEFLNH